MTTIIKNWDGSDFTLEDLDELILYADATECSVDSAMGGDAANSVFIIKGLIERIRELEGS